MASIFYFLGSSSSSPRKNKKEKTYVIKFGDTLGSISTEYKIHLDELMKINNISNNIPNIASIKLTPGKIIRLLPKIKKKSVESSTTSAYLSSFFHLILLLPLRIIIIIQVIMMIMIQMLI